MVNNFLVHETSQNISYPDDHFPVYIIRESLAKRNDGRILMHWHSDFEFLHITEGVLLYTVNGNNFELHAGDVLFINARQLHGSVDIQGQNYEYNMCMIHPDILTGSSYVMKKLINPLMYDDAFPYLLIRSDDPKSRKFADFTDRIIELVENHEDGYELDVISEVHSILRSLMQYRKTDSRAKVNWIVDDSLKAQRDMVSFIAEHYSEKITLDEIAVAGNVSRSTCSRLFRDYLQQTPIDFLNMYRLDESCRMLETSGLSISEIALGCGFSQPSYFNRQFQKRYSVTPSEYRKGLAN